MMSVFYDFHMHTCLSPCGGGDMTPANLAGMANLCGLNAIAAADHNTCLNCPAVLRRAEENGILAIPAMELTTSEEAHVLCLLPDLKAAAEFSDYVYSKLPDIPNKPGIFGEQLIVDGNDQVVGEEKKFLLAAADISVYEVSELLKTYGGAAIPAHIDRSSFSVLSNLGVWDALWGFTAYEQYDRSLNLTQKHPGLKPLNRIFNSDAHRLEDIRDAENTMELKTMSAKSVINRLTEISVIC